MTVGVNALYMIPGGVGGTEIYLRSLLTALAGIDRENRYLVFTNAETGADLIPRQDNFRQVRQRVRARVRPARILWEQTFLPIAAARHGIDVLFNPGFTSPVVCPCPTVTVFHDLQHKRHPEHFRWFELPFWRMLLFAAVRRSTKLIAVSEATKSDLMRYYNVPSGHVRVIGHSADPKMFGLAKLDRAQPPYLLAVSTLHPHKNLDRLLRAFAEFRLLRPDFRLVVAGLRGFDTRHLESLRTSLGLDDAVRFTGWIPREELYSLFAHARAFIYPSTFEGFGMPVIEALAAGLPTACSNIEPLATLAGDAALLFDPNSVPPIRDGITRIASDDSLRRRLAAAGPLRAAAYTWENAARFTLETLREASDLGAVC
ncbi:MAG: glycosyltransferase family 4 protein [Acidobacteriota bacterium]|nr:glycosyltransferase family 4 protein [Acidobacteriota bacterium]